MNFGGRMCRGLYYRRFTVVTVSRILNCVVFLMA